MINIPKTLLHTLNTAITLQNLSYNTEKKVLHAKYTMNNQNLSSLNTLTKQKLRGSMQIDGDIKLDKNLIVTGLSKKFDGEIDFKLVDTKLEANIKDASVLKITQMLSFPQYFDSKANGKLNYDLLNSKANLHITMNKALLLKSKLTSIVKSLNGLDLTKEHFNNAQIDARLNKNLINFDVDAKSKSASILIKNGKITQPQGLLDAKLDFMINKQTFKTKIYGTTIAPKIKLDATEVRAKAKEQLKEKVKDRVVKELKDRLHIDKKKSQEIIEGVFKKLF